MSGFISTPHPALSPLDAAKSGVPFRSTPCDRLLGVVLVLIFLLSAGCDSIEPSEDNLMVVEGFFVAGAPLPTITLSKALALDQHPSPLAQAINDASIHIFIDEQLVSYAPSNTMPGKYEPVENALKNVPSSAQFRAEIAWRSLQASTADFIPPPISIDSVDIKIPEGPVTAILVDTLSFDNNEVGARKGFIYLIDVTLWWTSGPETENDSTYWIETRIIPQSAFSSTVLDVFLLTEEVQLESTIALKTSSTPDTRSWTGVYAVPVPDSLSPPPAHHLTVQLIRSTKAYADFAVSRNTPERREPVSNMDGAIGVLAGIALDSIAFEVKDDLAISRR